MRSTTNRKRTLIGTAAVALTAAGLSLAPSVPAGAASVATWEKLARCESEGDWSYHQGTNLGGGLQFMPSTWEEFGGTEYAPFPYQATKEQQIRIGEKVLAVQGVVAWPNCWQQAGLTTDGEQPFPDVPAAPEQNEGADRTRGDFDGDGRDDLAVLYDYGKDGERNRSGLWTFTSNGAGFNSPRQVWDSGSDSWNWAASKVAVGDFNGDGKADIGVLYDDGKDGDRNRTKLYTFTSTGAGFTSPKLVWDSATDPVKSWNWAASKPVSGDFDGDGRTDLAIAYDYGKNGDVNRTAVWAFASTGTGFASPRKAWDSSTDPVKSWSWAASKPVAGDFDGDGKTDIGVLYDYGKEGDRNRSGLWTLTSTGTGFNSPRQVWDSGSDSWNWTTSKPVAGDFSGDGRTDVGVFYDYGRTDSVNRTAVWTFTSTGTGFAGPNRAWDSATDLVKSWSWAASKPVAGDFSGDGRTDLGVLYDYGQSGDLSRTGLWTLTSTGSSFAGPKKAWDSATDAVKSWNWTNSKIG
ncbi:transglycosylase family protein [Kitasatospora sp. NPDC058444]|uniref:transglycosylase family protein n=1 Tax=Kitasatospora sp. NPDC058444 TaxID=3346504 RepID=UPI00364B4B8D